MRDRKWLIFFALIMFLIFISIFNINAQETDESAPMGLRPDAPAYAVRGPHPVGFTSRVINDGNERPLDAYIWYPTLNPDGAIEQIDYPFYYFGDITVTGHALEEVEPDFANGPYPLIIFSHALGGTRMSSTYLTEHLASYGFVVIAVDYQDNLGAPDQPMFPSFVSRPLDVTRQIDYAESLTSPDGEWASLIDVEHIGVTGHSFGGFTALAAGGARLDWDHVSEICETYPDPLGTCMALLEQVENIAIIAGWDEVPESPWPSLGDERVDAIAPLAPGGRFFGPDGSSHIAVPVMLLGGTADTTAIPEYNFYPIYDSITTPKTQILFENSDHSIFFFDCADAPWTENMGLFWVCSDPVWDMPRAHDLIDHFVTAFFLTELYNDDEAAATLAPEAVQFPGIIYATTAY